MTLYLLPHAGARLSSWSLGDGTPPFDVSGEYFVFYSHGLDAPAWSFWIEIQVHTGHGQTDRHVHAHPHRHTDTQTDRQTHTHARFDIPFITP